MADRTVPARAHRSLSGVPVRGRMVFCGRWPDLLSAAPRGDRCFRLVADERAVDLGSAPGAP